MLHARSYLTRSQLNSSVSPRYGSRSSNHTNQRSMNCEWFPLDQLRLYDRSKVRRGKFRTDGPGMSVRLTFTSNHRNVDGFSRRCAVSWRRKAFWQSQQRVKRIRPACKIALRWSERPLVREFSKGIGDPEGRLRYGA